MPQKTVAEVAQEIRSELAEVRGDYAVLRAELTTSKALELLERLSVMEARTAAQEKKLDDFIADQKKSREESDRRVWNVVMIGLGAVLSLVGGLVVQLVLVGVRK